MARVVITINGKPYSLACDDGQEERIRAAGAVLGAGVENLAAQMGRVNHINLIVMASVLLADELAREQAAHQQQREQADRAKAAAADMEELAMALEYLADKVESVASRFAPE